MEIDIKKLDKIVQETFDKEMPRFKPKAEDSAKIVGFAGLTANTGIMGTEGLVAGWNKVFPWINRALKIIGPFAPAAVVSLARGVLAAVNELMKQLGQPAA